jgi:hypothetical protein
MDDKLYRVSHEIEVIYQDIIDAGGEITEDIEERLDACKLTFEEKTEEMGKVMLDIDNKTEVLSMEIKRLTARKDAAIKQKEWAKEAIKEAMERAGLKKYNHGLFSFTISKSPPKAEIVEEDAVPAKYLTIIPERTKVNKAVVLADLKKGIEVKGAVLAGDRTHLRIK